MKGNQIMDNLPELRDIHLPIGGVSVFPPAYGWWVILLLAVFLLLLIWLVRLMMQKSKKRYALEFLDKEPHNDITSAINMSGILRRICIYKYSHAVTLFGKDWIDFLNAHGKRQISGKTAQLLIDAPYINKESKTYSFLDINDLYYFCKSWIEENL
jgi:hypothetical protein